MPRSVKVDWNAPTLRSDGTALNPADIDSFKVYDGSNAVVATAPGTARTVTFEVAEGTYNYKVTAVDNESSPTESQKSPGSNAVVVPGLPAAPASPANVGATLL